MIKTGNGNFNLGWPVCQEIHTTGDSVKQYLGGMGVEFSLAMSTKNLKITAPPNLEFSTWCTAQLFVFKNHS